MRPDELPFRTGPDTRNIASREDYVSECEMIENDHRTKCIQMMAFDESDFVD